MDAVIDIGSNSVRLAYIKSKVNPKKINTTFLAEGLASSGFLSFEAIERTANAVIAFYDEAISNGAETVYIFGTEAMRSGKNSHLLVEKVKEKTGVSIDIISGEDEAKAGFVGASDNRKCCIVDIGGASIEIVEGEGKIERGLSLPLGVMRVLDVCSNDEKKISDYYEKEVSKYPRFTYPLIGIGGTATSLSAMALGVDEYDAVRNHGSTLSLSTLYELKDKIFACKSPDEVFEKFPVIGKKRAKVIGVGCIALIKIMEYLSYFSLTISEADNVEGYYAIKTQSK